MAFPSGAHKAGEPRQASRGRLALAYGLMLAACVLLFLLVRVYGERLPLQLPAVPGNPAAATGDSQHGSLFHVLVALITVIAAARGIGALFRRFHQPPVMGEVLAGLLLGPSFLGWLFPGAASTLIHPASIPLLGVIAHLGVISPQLFAMLVIMAVVTTFATTPILDLLTSETRSR